MEIFASDIEANRRIIRLISVFRKKMSPPKTAAAAGMLEESQR